MQCGRELSPFVGTSWGSGRIPLDWPGANTRGHTVDGNAGRVPWNLETARGCNDCSAALRGRTAAQGWLPYADGPFLELFVEGWNGNLEV